MKQLPRLCILSQYYLPEMGAPQGRLSELAERLVDLDWGVEVLTALPNYPTGRVFPSYDPARPCVERIGRVRTVRVPLYTANSGFVKRLRSYFSFVASARANGPTLCQRPDLLYVETPPLFIGSAARYLSKYWKCPYVLNVSDLWPESAIRMGIIRRGMATELLERYELKLYRQAAGVTGQSSEIIDWIHQRSPTTPTAVITNGVDPTRFGRDRAEIRTRNLLGSEPGPVFVYAGLLGLAQGLDQVLDLAKSLPGDIPGRLVLIGDGPNRTHLESRIRAESIKRVTILPVQPRAIIPRLLTTADAALISLGMSLPGAVPSKIYEAMASSLPILLLADGEPAARVLAANAGLVVNPGDLPSAKRAFCRLATDPQLRQELGAGGRQAAESTYSRDIIAKRLNDFLRCEVKHEGAEPRGTGVGQDVARRSPILQAAKHMGRLVRS